MRRLLPLLALALLACGCGKKGDPRPPLPDLPARITALSVRQQGMDAVLAFPFPSLQENGRPLRDLSRVEIYRIANPPAAFTEKAPAAPGAAADQAPISGVRRRALAARQREEQILGAAQRLAVIGADRFGESTRGADFVYRDPLGALLSGASPARELAYAVVTVRRAGQRSELSNLATLAPVVPPAAPTDLLAVPEEHRVCLSWTPPDKNVAGGAAEPAGYNVYRRLLAEEDYGRPLNAKPVAETEYADTTAAYGAAYVYTVTALARDHPDSEGPPAIQFGLDYRDVFAPPAVTRLDALPEPGDVTLLWPGVAAPDLAGYEILRAEGDAPLAPVARVPPAQTRWKDADVRAGERYRYQVRAVDNAGNRGPASPEVAAVPYAPEK